MAGDNPFDWREDLGDHGEASFSLTGDSECDALRKRIHGLRRGLWRFEQALALLETRSRTEIDPDRMRPQFATMFESLVSVNDGYLSLCLGVFGEEDTIDVVQSFSKRFDHLRQK